MHPLFSRPLNFNESNCHTLVAENTNTIFQMIKMLRQQVVGEPGDFVLSLDDKPVAIHNRITLIVDPFSLDASSRKIINHIIQEATEIALGEDYYMQTIELLTMISTLGTRIMDDLDYPIVIADEFDVQTLLKFFDVKVSLNASTLAEELIEYINIVTKITKTVLFVFVNIFNYLEEAELYEFGRNIDYLHGKVLFIESNFFDNKGLGPVKIIDGDLCEIDI